MTASVLEIWFWPTGGMDTSPTLLETRAFRPDTDPPATYTFEGVDLLAGSSRILGRDNETVHQVYMVDADYAAPAQTS